jgi:nicotinamidase-related amidase
MLQADNTTLVLIDVQEKLLPAIHEHDALVRETRRLLAGAKALGVPVVFTEQNPAGLGATVQPVAELLEGAPVTKMTFDCCGAQSFLDAVELGGRNQVLLAGIEAHVCVCQTVLSMVSRGFGVFVVADAIGSRTATSKAVAVQRMRAAGATVVNVEMALFEMLQTADAPAFKQILRIVK